MLEIWRTAVYDGEVYEDFEVSNLGRIKSLNYRRTGRAELLKPGENIDGYFFVIVSKNKETKTCLVHRLVAFTFLENPENLPEVNHKDEDKTNNFVFLNEDGSVDKEKSNLEWKNHRDNCNHGTRNKRSAKARSKKVLQLSLSGELIREWPSAMEIQRQLGFHQSAICNCCNGKLPHYKGFKWCYE